MTQTAEQEPVRVFQQPPFAEGLALHDESDDLPWRPADIQAGLEWALENNNDTAQMLSTIGDTNRWHESGNGVRYKSVSNIFTPKGLLIRRAQTSVAAEQLGEMVKAASFNAKQNVTYRSDYDTSVNKIHEASKENQHRINVKRGLRSLGETVLGGGALALENLAYIGSMPANIALGAVATGLVYESITWAGKTLQIQSRRRRWARGINNPPLQQNAEAIWGKMSGACEDIVAAYRPDDQEGDIEILEGAVVIDIDVTKEKLRRPGGPALEKYADVLKYLSSIADEKHGKNTHQLFPISMVKEILESSDGKIWGDELMSALSIVADAQHLLWEKTEALTELKKEKKKVTKGMQISESIESLKKDVRNVTGTIILGLLELLRINHEYNTLQDSTKKETEPVITDPFEGNDF